MKTKEERMGICEELRLLQRRRSITIKSRLMAANRLQAIVAGTLGYSNRMTETERGEVFKKASDKIKAVMAGEEEHEFKSVIKTTYIGIQAFNDLQSDMDKAITDCVKELDESKWACHKDQRGFGLLMMGIILGETGDLSNYSHPGKVWRRMGCAPWTFNETVAMGSTWRFGKQGKLPASEWSEFGYSPRRRSIIFLLGEGLIKQNQDGPYRKRYDEAKERYQQLHLGYSKKRCHWHGMLVCSKMLLKNLWIEWNPELYDPEHGRVMAESGSY